MKDNSRFWSFCILILLGGVIYFSKEPLKNPDAPASAPTPVATASVELVGGITSLKSEDLTTGTGKTAKSGDSLTVNYQGTLLNGTEFDSSYGREPFKFQLGSGSVIKGWDEGIPGMKEGGKRKLTIPASLGYGDKGSGDKIPGGATLVFEIELLKVGS